MTQSPIESCDMLLSGGRVIDPDSDTDGILNVAITGGTITYVGQGAPSSRRTVNCTGLVVAPGFIDLHSHTQSVVGHQLQALDGVTTALDLEGGDLLVAARYAEMQRQGRPINYGYSASWGLARARVVAGREFKPDRYSTSFAALQEAESIPGAGRPASAIELGAILNALDESLLEGAIGIGVILGYLPDTEPSEFLAIAQLAADRSVGTFTHSRTAARFGDFTAYDAVLELTSAAETTGAAMHLCHVNSTSDRWMESIVGAIDAAQGQGLKVTTEAYPYTRGSTVIGAPFLSADGLREEGRTPSSLIYVATGESIADEVRLNELREHDPGGIVMTLSYDESDPIESALMDRAMALPGAAFASDSIPLVKPGGALAPDEVWPPSPDWFAHPRSAGCYAKVFRWLVRDRGLLSLSEAVRRCSLLPAQILEQSAPSMKRKGRLQVDMDADIVVLDPNVVADRGSYTAIAPSVGFAHVIVGGTSVVTDGELVPSALPGQPVFGARYERGAVA